MKNNYRIGENVIFLDFTNNGNITIKQGSDLTLNKIYKVEYDSNHNISLMGRVWIKNDVGELLGYSTRYYKFESVKVYRKKKLLKICH
jgi:hypothetical protein